MQDKTKQALSVLDSPVLSHILKSDAFKHATFKDIFSYYARGIFLASIAFSLTSFSV